ncbi:MAG: hypothetical protein JSR66_01385 [Proteobacteria bacterium]|nr:hypothetical protein [Pseudomonadota bacterium]
MNAAEKQLRARNLRLLAGLAGLFLLPLAVAFWLYYATDWRPIGTVNHGELIQPPRPLPAYSGLPADLFHRKWTLVYIGDGQCDDACRNALLVMRQTRLSLNNEMTRVERVFLATGNCCAQDFLQREHPGLKVFAAPADLKPFPAGEQANSVFIVDPLGNLMMRHDARQNPKGFLQDLKILLKYSQIG